MALKQEPARRSGMGHSPNYQVWGTKSLSPVAGILFTGDMAAASATTIHAAFAGNDADNDFPGAFTQPTQPRVLTVTFGAAWDGGVVTVHGTDVNGVVVREVFTPGAGTTVVGTVEFATVTSATKAAVGASANTASIGTNKIRGRVSLLGDHMIVTYTFKWPATGTPIGVISFEVSNNWDERRPNDATWIAVAAPSDMRQPAGTADAHGCTIGEAGWKAIRPVYTQTSGGTAATLESWVTIKGA